MERRPSGAVRRARRDWCGQEASGAVTEATSRGARRAKAPWAARRTGCRRGEGCRGERCPEWDDGGGGQAERRRQGVVHWREKTW